MVYGVVYRITCSVNRKCYHGQTVNLKARWPQHFRAGSQCVALKAAIRKHGRHHFTCDVVATAASQEELDLLEKQFIASSLAPFGYNIQEGGANGPTSEATKKKISVAVRKAYENPALRAKVGQAVREAMAQPHIKKKVRKAAKKRANRPEAKARARDTMLSLHADPDKREQQRDALRESWANLSPEERIARIQNQKDAYTPEVRERLGDISRETQARPEVKANHRKGVRDSWTLERRAAASSRMKALHEEPEAKEQRGRTISKALNTAEAKLKMARRRRRGESVEEWEHRIHLKEN